MPPSFENARDFAQQLEKTLAARRLYNPTSTPYREANERLVEKMHAASGPDGVTFRVEATELFLDDRSVLSKTRREEAFFFPLYRDGLRELTDRVNERFGPYPEFTTELAALVRAAAAG